MVRRAEASHGGRVLVRLPVRESIRVDQPLGVGFAVFLDQPEREPQRLRLTKRVRLAIGESLRERIPERLGISQRQPERQPQPIGLRLSVCVDIADSVSIR